MIQALILLAGVVLALGLAVLMLNPRLRIPAIVVALLAIPGNLDNFVPQMQMDWHAVANNTGPAVSVIDLFLGFGIVLTLREGRLLDHRGARLMVAVALGVALLACLIAAVSAVFLDVEPAAALRGALTFLRIPAVMYLAFALMNLDPKGIGLSLAATVGAVSLIGNGLYTSAVENHDRFTAATFGRNGLGMVLVVAGLMAAGTVMTGLRGGLDRRVVAFAAIVGAASLVGAIGTGTRMSLVALGVALLAALVAVRAARVGLRLQAAGLLGVLLAIVVVATFVTASGTRTVSVVTDVDEIVDTVTDYENVPSYSEVRSRMNFWSQALRMAIEHPLTGVGPYQWNIERYDIDPQAPAMVANPHNTYLQIAAEFGVLVLVAYLALLGFVLWQIVMTYLWRGVPEIPWSKALVVGCALAVPVTELTNSHLFNVRLGPFDWLLASAALAWALATEAPPRADRPE